MEEEKKKKNTRANNVEASEMAETPNIASRPLRQTFTLVVRGPWLMRNGRKMKRASNMDGNDAVSTTKVRSVCYS